MHTQPQWWVLAQVARADTATTRDEASRVLRGYLDTGPEAMDSEIDETLAQGWLTEDAEGRLRLTADGRAFHDRAAALQGGVGGDRGQTCAGTGKAVRPTVRAPAPTRERKVRTHRMTPPGETWREPPYQPAPACDAGW
ncbi:hypothetical protein [Streptomyces lydicus]|uniref:hypothetical protein n=1 Tax=Streptomyces lydicus TaxID=47763 RepID=UPI0036E420C5